MVPAIRLSWFVAFLGIAAFTGCGGTPSDLPPASIKATSTPGDTTPGDTDAEEITVGPVRLTAEDPSGVSPARQADSHPLVLIRTSMGEIKIKLDSEKASQTVENFLTNYVDRGFYEDTVIHYVEPGVMVAGGGYTADFQAKETRTEIRNEANNGLTNRRGTIAMARHPDFAHSATSQFFFNLGDNTFLDYQDTGDGEPNGYCVFGEVISGMDVVDAMAAVEVADRGEFPNTPKNPIVIQAVERVK